MPSGQTNFQLVKLSARPATSNGRALDATAPNFASTEPRYAASTAGMGLTGSARLGSARQGSGRLEPFSRPSTAKPESEEGYLQAIRARETRGLGANTTTLTLMEEMNEFSRPVKSLVTPLRTAFLDPKTNNFPPSKTRTELLAKIRATRLPHPSYDLDNDGYVSQEDYRVSKRFDFNGNGVLEGDEREACKKVLAEEFFKANADDMEYLGPEYASNTLEKNVELICSAQSFDLAYEKLKRMQNRKATSSKRIHECMRLPKDNPLTEHNFFTNKFDPTAWNDFDAIPRSASKFGLNDHGGSRKRLMFSRQQIARESAFERIEYARQQQPLVNTRRLKLITDPKVENS